MYKTRNWLNILVWRLKSDIEKNFLSYRPPALPWVIYRYCMWYCHSKEMGWLRQAPVDMSTGLLHPPTSRCLRSPTCQCSAAEAKHTRLNTTTCTNVTYLEIFARKDWVWACRTRAGCPKPVQFLHSVSWKQQRPQLQSLPHTVGLVWYAHVQPYLYSSHLCCQQLFSLVCGDWYKVINYLPLAVVRETIWDKFKRNRQDWGCSDARQGSGWSSWQQPGGSQGCGEEEWWYTKRLSSGDTC